jgi:hypothetical protein
MMAFMVLFISGAGHKFLIAAAAHIIVPNL